MNYADVGRNIEQNLAVFRQPGVLSVRPGYHLDGGWPVGDPIIVVLVAAKKGEAPAYNLPMQIQGIPLEVREASALEAMKTLRPQTYAMYKSRANSEQHTPDFDFEHLLAAQPQAEAGAAAAPAKTKIPYVPASLPLAPVTGTFAVICHVSPDAGWPTLQAFFQRVESRLTVGMYDFTSSHILTSLNGSLIRGGSTRPLSLVLDHPTRNPTADQTDEETEVSLSNALGGNLEFDWAPVRSSPEVNQWIFPTAYHIKVAVRDGAEVWLSSGNWNNSNQPENAPVDDPDPTSAAATFKKSDRDWHVIITSQVLAQLFEAYLIHDRESAVPCQGHAAMEIATEALAEQAASLAEQNPAATARSPGKYFAPLTVNEAMTIQPLLTPDLVPGESGGIYAQKMLELISGAQASLYIQLQYIHPSSNADDDEFTALLKAVSDRHAAGVDVRIILSQWQNSQWMERLAAAGVDTELVRIQNGVHNKGFVVDHRRVVVSSQNWSAQGVEQNRDAGVIIDNATIAQYFESIFLQDWNTVAVSHSNQRQFAAVESAPASVQILGWQDDPGATDPPLIPPESRVVPDLTTAPLQLEIGGAFSPAPGDYATGSPEFRYWCAAEAAARGAALWRGLLPAGTSWQPGEPLQLLLDQGEDFNAYYDRKALNFFHGTAAGRTVYSGESPDIVCHEQGHAILDALRPELFDAGTIEAAAFHESFGDISAILAALQLPSMRVAVLSDTAGNLARTSRLSRLAEQLGWAIRQIAPTAVDPDCLRNAANSFFYTNPETLPPNAPAAALSSEPHSFSRIFTGAYLEALAGALRLRASVPLEADLLAVSQELAAILVAGVQAAPIVPDYMSQVAACMVAAANTNAPQHVDAVKSAFVRRGILSPQSATGVTNLHFAGIAPMAHDLVSKSSGISRELPLIALSAAEYGFGDLPLLVRAPSDPRRFSAAAASFGAGVVTPSNSEHSARAFVEDLLQRGHLDTQGTDFREKSVPHHLTFKTHRLVRTSGGLMLSRILFDCGFRGIC